MGPYSLHYDPSVAHDLKRLDKARARKILKAVQKKLTQAPMEYGKALRRDLKGFWRLRVDDDRVIYEINSKRKIVTIWFIGPRRDDEVYLDFLKKLKQG
jgi:mRNA interferase RelE/StbE